MGLVAVMDATTITEPRKQGRTKTMSAHEQSEATSGARNSGVPMRPEAPCLALLPVLPSPAIVSHCRFCHLLKPALAQCSAEELSVNGAIMSQREIRPRLANLILPSSSAHMACLLRPPIPSVFCQPFTVLHPPPPVSYFCLAFITLTALTCDPYS